MCNEQQLAHWGRAMLDRRTFGAGTLAAGAAACAPVGGGATSRGTALRERTVSFATGAGTLDGEFFAPETGQHPGVIFWPDIAGIRDAKRQMARRLAASGHAVLLANPYYRDVAGQQFEDFASFAASGGFQTVRPWRSKFNAETIGLDNRAAAAWLLEQGEVGSAGKIGVQGYCMTGAHALRAPGVHPRIIAGASFHGGGLVTDSADSPHRSLSEDGHYLVAISQDDDAEAPTHDDQLRAMSDEAASLEVEIYPADHGFCVLDSSSYDEVQAERAWARLLALYERAL